MKTHGKRNEHIGDGMLLETTSRHIHRKLVGTGNSKQVGSIGKRQVSKQVREDSNSEPKTQPQVGNEMFRNSKPSAGRPTGINTLKPQIGGHSQATSRRIGTKASNSEPQKPTARPEMFGEGDKLEISGYS